MPLRTPFSPSQKIAGEWASNLSFKSCVLTDLEEAKGQEISKLQISLQVMQNKVDETNALLIKEREAAQKAIEEASSVIKETPVLVQDTQKMETLTTEVEELKPHLVESVAARSDSEKLPWAYQQPSEWSSPDFGEAVECSLLGMKALGMGARSSHRYDSWCIGIWHIIQSYSLFWQGNIRHLKAASTYGYKAAYHSELLVIGYKIRIYNGFLQQLQASLLQANPKAASTYA
ncbi:hypothetical protein U1Q18_025177 [Sarracenia purpurea var. burkii]